MLGESVPFRADWVDIEMLITELDAQETPLQELHTVLSDAQDQPVGGTVNPIVRLHIQ